MFTNPRYANEVNGILLEQLDGVDLYVDAGEIYDAAKAGAYGPVAPYIPPPPPTNEQVGNQVRSERNRRLAASDWTQVSDAPVNQAAWAIYRQALRDIPEQSGFPHFVEWPITPLYTST